MNRFKAYSDENLLDLSRGRDIAAFEEIYHRYWKPLYSACFRRIQSREISEEIVQDVFTSLWTNRNMVVITNLSAYLFTAIKYKVINHLARELSRTTYEGHQAMLHRQDNSTEEYVLLGDLKSALEREVEKLPAKRKMIFRLHKDENLSLKQVASQMGISEKTVENQYGKAIKVLKVNLRHFTFAVGTLLIVRPLQELLTAVTY
ncbi:MAG: RNA polymerase sigma-70 factor [Chryseolinea sp.]